jgi:hypothetical protein
MAPLHEASVKAAFEEYRWRVFPFRCIACQQNEFNRKEKISPERLLQIERQLYRFDEVESKLENIKHKLNSNLTAHSRRKQLSFIIWMEES